MGVSKGAHDVAARGVPVSGAVAEADKWVINCMRAWLSRLNPRLWVVVFFGLTDGYMKGVDRSPKRAAS
jgi:hypothetical protein